MKIQVFDVPASSGGALTILKGFYEAAKAHTDIQWEFVIGTAVIEPTDNITVRKFNWVKKSWLHRLYFDLFKADGLVRKYKPDVIFSMQNTCVMTTRAKQVLYIHQPIPFTDIIFKLRKSPVEWVYQHIISKLIYRSARKAVCCIAQTRWMQDAIAEKAKIGKEHIAVIRPDCNADITEYYMNTPVSVKTFFYPAAENSYKNHRVIVKASKILVEKGIRDFCVYFTLDKKETVDDELISDVPEIKCIGTIPYSEVMKMYSQSTLIFPSKLETFGLPLLEAALVHSRVVAADKPFSHEILDNYPNVWYFDVDSPKELATIMENILSAKDVYVSIDNEWYNKDINSSGWTPVIELLQKFCS